MTDIEDYYATLTGATAETCNQLRELIGRELPTAMTKVWHGHPVWFINDNPIVGFSLKRGGVQLLFWSGQSFSQPGLVPVGKYKAAEIDIPSVSDINETQLKGWLEESQSVQWDYANLPSNRELRKLTEF